MTDLFIKISLFQYFVLFCFGLSFNYYHFSQEQTWGGKGERKFTNGSSELPFKRKECFLSFHPSSCKDHSEPGSTVSYGLDIPSTHVFRLLCSYRHAAENVDLAYS